MSGDNANVAGFFVTDGVDVVRRALFILFLVRDAKFKKQTRMTYKMGKMRSLDPCEKKNDGQYTTKSPTACR